MPAHPFAGACALVMLLTTGIAAAGPLEDGIAAHGARDYARAFTLLRPLAGQGDPHAQNLVGLMYANGQGVKRDDGQAVHWFRQAAQRSHDKAQRNLAYMLANGRGRAVAEDKQPECQ